ncbi:hypothetical protein Bbelb_351530 [Branchiostoma belcheri]|nr:hypothetical protein Bbelb_351530 [Branchiostoma belcheri]
MSSCRFFNLFKSPLPNVTFLEPLPSNRCRCYLFEHLLNTACARGDHVRKVSARPRVGSPDGRRPEGDPTRGRAGTEAMEAFDNGFRTGPYRKVRPGPEPVIERYRGPGMI